MKSNWIMRRIYNAIFLIVGYFRLMKLQCPYCKNIIKTSEICPVCGNSENNTQVIIFSISNNIKLMKKFINQVFYKG